MLTLLCASPSSSPLPTPVRVTVAASPPTPRLFEQMSDLNLHPVHVYGLTETYGPITRGYPLPAWDALEKHERFARLARQGHGFLTSLGVRVVRVGEDGGVVMPMVDVRRDGVEVGEVVFEGNICASGYVNDWLLCFAFSGGWGWSFGGRVGSGGRRLGPRRGERCANMCF